jgi:cupin fold WbuC family metalloprotein
MLKSRDKNGNPVVLDSTPEAEFNDKPIIFLGNVDIEYLKKCTLQSPRNRYRLCLHKNHESLIQEMVICLKGFSYFHPHRHPENRSESYHMIEGRLDVYLLNKYGQIIEKVELIAPSENQKEKKPFMYRVSESVYHFTVPRTEWTIYHEVLAGPWDAGAIQYAPFAPGEKDIILMNNYVKNITGYFPNELIS